MAIDPQQIATEQTQRAALAQGGAPTEMAGSPEDAVRLAGLVKLAARMLLSSINKLGKSVSVDAVVDTVTPARPAPPAAGQTPAGPASGEVGAAPTVTSDAPTIQQPSRVPTPAEIGVMQNPGAYSETATKKLLAPEVLSPEGLEKFKAMGYKADGTPPEADPLLDRAEGARRAEITVCC